MDDVAEATGTAAQGGLLARTAEREELGSPAAKGHTDGTACLNCGTDLLGPHCHQCGQNAHVHRTLSAFFHDLLHGVLHFEGKIWRTQRRPGERLIVCGTDGFEVTDYAEWKGRKGALDFCSVHANQKTRRL